MPQMSITTTPKSRTSNNHPGGAMPPIFPEGVFPMSDYKFSQGDTVCIANDGYKHLRNVTLRIDSIDESIGDGVATVCVISNPKMKTARNTPACSGTTWQMPTQSTYIPDPSNVDKLGNPIRVPVAYYTGQYPAISVQKNELVGFRFRISLASLAPACAPSMAPAPEIMIDSPAPAIMKALPAPVSETEQAPETEQETASKTEWNGEERRGDVDPLIARGIYVASLGAHVDICGAWLWAKFAQIPAETTREALKSNGWRWSKAKGKWYFAGCVSTAKRRYSWNEIVARHGVQDLEEIASVA
jgi:hypothetical protein